MPRAAARRLRRRAPAALAAVVLLSVAGASSPAAPRERLTPPAAYYRPVLVDGMTFPVARSNWHSVIEFENDWHDPRFRLVSGAWRLVGFHEGVDIVAEKGTPILAAAPGVVERVGWTFYSGTRVGVRGADGRYYFYAHLSEVAPGIAVGAPVAAGDTLGLVGNTGYGPPGQTDEFPPHLHFGIQESADWIDPFPLVSGLYRRSVAATARQEARLEALARAGRPEAWRALVDRLYAPAG